MGHRTATPLPALRRILAALGEDLRLARLRRRISATLLADRAGMSRPTLRAIERGEPGVTLGAYASVLHSLGLDQNLALLARDDVFGRELQDAQARGTTAQDAAHRTRARTQDHEKAGGAWATTADARDVEPRHRPALAKVRRERLADEALHDEKGLALFGLGNLENAGHVVAPDT
jgi:transcriptional regulator with XRE-family HTH domain